MYDDTQALVQRYWTLMQANDWVQVGTLLADDFELRWPQSGERIRGRERYAQMNAAYPAAGRWRFRVERCLVHDDQAVTVVAVSDGQRHDHAISFFSVAAGRITHLVEYWPEPFAPAANRAHLVERGPDAAE